MKSSPLKSPLLLLTAAVALVAAALFLWSESGAEAPVAVLPADAEPDGSERRREAPLVDERTVAPVTRLGAHGDCLEVGSEAPVPGVVLQLRTRDGVLATSAPDAEGAFRFERAGDERTWLDVLAPEGWTRRGEPDSLSREQRSGAEPIHVRLMRSESAPVEGRLVDERTDEPVPSCLVRISARGEYEECWTGEDGTFRSVGSYPAGSVELDLREPHVEIEVSGRQRNSWTRLIALDRDHVPGRSLGDVPTPIGPTYRVTLPQLVPDAPPWFFRIVERSDPPEVSGMLWTDVRGRLAMESTERASARVWNQTHLRETDGRYWVRFPYAQFEPRSSMDVYLEGVTRDTIGRGSVETTVGIHPAPVALALGPNAELLGHVTAGDIVDPKGLSILLVPDYGGGPSTTTPDWFGHGVTVEGDFRLESVAVGDFTLVVAAPRYEVHVAPLHLTPGRTVLPAIELAPSARDSAHVLVEGESESRVAVLQALYSSPLGLARVSPGSTDFSFWGLPDGRYRLALQDLEGEFGAFELTPGPDPLVVRAGDLRRTELRYDWGDSRDVVAIHDFGGGLLMQQPAPKELRKRVWTPPSIDTGRVRLWREQHRPLELEVDEALLDRDRLDVAFEPGWGAVLHLRQYSEEARQNSMLLSSLLQQDLSLEDRDPIRRVLKGAPVPGARVWSDVGSEAVSDASGAAALTSREVPGAVRVDRRGWRVVHLERLGAGPANEYVVWMLPERHLPDHD